MKKILTLIAFASLALTGCGGSQTEENPVELVNANVSIDESQFAGITDANAALAEGDRLLDENQTQSAISAFRRAIEINPDLAEAHFKLGIAYDLFEMQMEREGIAVEPVSSNTNSKDGRIKSNSEKSFERAVEAYKKWVAANPKDDVAYFNLGRTYAKLTQDEEAEESFEEAIKLKPDETEYQTELGAILIKLAKYREAIEPLKKAIELDPANVRAEAMLEDAEAGRKRVDYVSPKNTNQAAPNKSSNSNVNSDSNSNTTAKPLASNSKPTKDEPKDTRPRMISNKP